MDLKSGSPSGTPSGIEVHMIDKRKLQMADIAKLAGVSTATVSRALNGSESIRPETRERIQALAQAHQYTVHAGAKNLRSGENRTLGLVIPYSAHLPMQLTDPFFLAMMGQLADAMTAAQYDLLLSRVDADRLDECAALYDSGRVAGIVMVGQWDHHDQLNALAKRRVPLVVWGAMLPDQLYCSVGSDNFNGGLQATSHLIEKGRRHIAYLGDFHSGEAKLRFDGYCQALKKNNIALRPELCIRSPYTPLEAQQAMHGFCDKGIQIDGLFAASDLIAINAMGVLNARGFKVPDDIAVVGYDDVDASRHSFPPLSTIRQPLDLAARVLLESLLEVMRSGQPASRQLSSELVVRAST
jgi:DNA-binding LacI/PurR family transcriptional regulator